MAHVLRALGHPQHFGGDVEAHLLRVAVLETVGADLHGQHEIPDEDLVGPERRIAGSGRIAARRQQPVVDARRAAGLPLLGDQRADLRDRFAHRSRRCAATGRRARRESRENPARTATAAECRALRAIRSDPSFRPMRPGAIDESRDALRRQMVEQPPLRLVGRVDHHAMEAVPGAAPAADPKSGAWSANSTAISFVRAASGASAADAGGGIRGREEADLDVVHAGRGDLLGLGADRFGLHRQVAADGAGRAASGDGGHDLADGRRSPPRPARRPSDPSDR